MAGTAKDTTASGTAALSGGSVNYVGGASGGVGGRGVAAALLRALAAPLRLLKKLTLWRPAYASGGVAAAAARRGGGRGSVSAARRASSAVPTERPWSMLPADVIAVLLDLLDGPTTAHVRLACSSWKSSVDAVLEHLTMAGFPGG
eukprot:364697-Chlamydomonas_euryale.AAC.2